MFQTLHSSLKWIKGRKATGATGATKDCSVRSLLQCLFGLCSKKHLQSWKLWVIMDLGHNFSFYPLFWCIEGFEEVKAESWSISFFTCFLLEQGSGRESTGKASRMQFLPSHRPGSSLWDWSSEKSFKRLSARQAGGSAQLIYRSLSKILIQLNLSAYCNTPLPSEHQQLCSGWIHMWSKNPQLVLCWKGPGALPQSARELQGWGQQWGLQEHLRTNRHFMIQVTKLLLTCTKGLSHFKIYPS